LLRRWVWFISNKPELFPGKMKGDSAKCVKVFTVFFGPQGALKILQFSQKSKVRLMNAVRLMYESGCAFSSRINFMW